MTNKSTLITALILAVMAISGCKKYLEFEGENKPPRLVLNGQMDADSVFMIDLTHSKGYVDQGEIKGVEDGVVHVKLSNGDLVETLTHIGEGRYRGEQVAMVGQAYRVEASAPAYDPIFAMDVVPTAVEIASWDTSTVQSGEESFQSPALNVSFLINDPGGMANYYMLEAFELRSYELWIIGVDPGTGEPIYDTVYFPEPQRYSLSLATSDMILTSEYETAVGETEIHSNRFLFSDELFNGGQRQLQFMITNAYMVGELELRLSSCSADLFNYYRSYERYQYTIGDPFSEPVQVFTNIQGGLGIWGGRSSHTVLIAQ